MIVDFLNLFVDYSKCIIPAFLFALLISAILAETLPESFFENILASKGILLVFISSIVGALIPLCTCGMIPLASKLQKKGTSWLIVISFLTAGNASSLTALFMTMVLGLKITILRFFFAVIFGIITAYIFVLIFKPTSKLNEINIEEECHSLPVPQRIIKEFASLIFCFGPWVLVAISVGTLISMFIRPEDVVKFAGSRKILSPFLLALGGFPFYFCAGTDIPISKALLDKGASLGSILSFMTASPGVNITSLIIYQRWLGLKSSVIYLGISFLVCGILGVCFNIFLIS